MSPNQFQVNHSRSSFLSGLSDDAILANAMLFFVAGYDTTSNSLSFFMYNMALHPECQDKLSEEIERVIGEKVRAGPGALDP